MALDEHGRIGEELRKTKVQRATRLAWLAVIGAAAIAQLFTGSGLSQADRFASKISLVVLGVVLWHLGRSQLFFYMDLKAWHDTVWTSTDMQAKATYAGLVFIGICILALAIIVGMTTGL